ETRIDLPTVAAIGILAYFLTSLFHEGGHALVGVALGVKSLKLTNFDVEFDGPALPGLQSRFVAFGGMAVNLLVAALLLVALRRGAGHAVPHRRYFLWLLAHINLLVAGGYLMALSFVHFGDVDAMLSGLPYTLLL